MLLLAVLLGTHLPTGPFRRTHAARLLHKEARVDELSRRLGLEEAKFSPPEADHVSASLDRGEDEDLQSFAQVCSQSFTLLCMAEIFDRTWFVTLLASLHHGPVLTFCASFTALALHSVMAVAFGGNVAALLPKWSLELIAAILLGAFAIVYAWECYTAVPDQDILTRRRREAEEEAKKELAAGANPQEDGDGGDPASGGGRGAAPGPHETGGLQKQLPRGWAGFATVFSIIFIAEWGDRTQLVQITLAASYPWLPVLLGSLLGLCLLCLSAATLARCLEGWSLQERYVNLGCAVVFSMMAVMAVYNASREPGFPKLISLLMAQTS